VNTPPARIVKNVSVSHLNVDGNKAHQTMECWGGPCDSGGTSFVRNNGITIRGAEHVKVQEVDLHDTRSGGMVTEKHCDDLQVRRMKSTKNFFDGLAGYETENSDFSDLDLSNNNGAAVSIDIRFNKNTIRDSKFSGNRDVGIFARDLHGNTFKNIDIENSGNHGIFLAQANPEDVATCANDNVFEGLTIRGSRGSALRLNDKTCTGNLVRDSVFADNRDGGLSVAEGGRVELIVGRGNGQATEGAPRPAATHRP
jgi:hypothetical protein